MGVSVRACECVSEEKVQLRQRQAQGWTGSSSALTTASGPCSSYLPRLDACPLSRAMSVAAADGPDDVYECLERYGWDDDVEFQSGLSAILGSTSSPEQASELTLRARCFYYARSATGGTI